LASIQREFAKMPYFPAVRILLRSQNWNEEIKIHWLFLLISLVEFLLGLGDITFLRFSGTNIVRSCSPLELQMGPELFFTISSRSQCCSDFQSSFSTLVRLHKISNLENQYGG